MRRGQTLLFLALLVLLAGTAIAQVVITSTIVGTVTDPKGAVIPHATVVMRNTDTGVQVTANTNETGAYQFPNLLAGHYRVEVSMAGFASI